ncbi:N-acetyltransferase family protein [Natroniella sp. ANB-PHB2]|uniref:GNAT family N-acetyltransferase n=1 Tax=Natroniella sp. ANB-PHB2 TaxID=3384444 RepID=UPI0038D45EBD
MQQYVYANEGRVLLREATEDDISKIYEMYQDTTPKLWWKDEDLSKFHANLLKEVNGRMFVAVLDDAVIGYAELILPESTEEHVYLVRLEIHDDFRRRKFGIELVRYTAIIMKGLGYEGYITWPNTDKSKGLYKKVGLKEIKEEPQLSVEIVAQRENLEVEKIGELNISERPQDLNVMVGCPWARDYTWLKSFKAGQKKLLNYVGPYVHQVKVDNFEAVVLFNGRSVYICAQEQELPAQIIEQLLAYASNLALDNDVEQLHINIEEAIWSEIDLSDIWEIEKEEERLEMKMDFNR